jgi:hypothetical protein
MPPLAVAAADEHLLHAAIESTPMPPLDTGTIVDGPLHQWLTEHAGHWRTAQPVAAMADACLSGLWLLCNDLDRSHSISQSLQTAEGSYWHGLMHCREGDFDNARYWMHRVGTHGIDAPLAACIEQTPKLAQWTKTLVQSGRFQADAMVDACRIHQARSTKPFPAKEPSIDSVQPCQGLTEVAWLQWQCLFQWCWQRRLRG